MGKGKRKCPIPKKGLNWAQKQQNAMTVNQIADELTYRQFMLDMIVLTLNDPAVMGKDTFGKDRLLKIGKAIGDKYDLYFGALQKKPETDYIRERLDDALRRALRGWDGFHPFLERYDWIPEIKTGVKK